LDEELLSRHFFPELKQESSEQQLITLV